MQTRATFVRTGPALAQGVKIGLLAGAASWALLSADQAFAQAPAAVSEVVVTGSLIRGAATVGVPVQALGAQQFSEQAAISVSDVFRDVPAVNVVATDSHASNASDLTGAQKIAIHTGAGGTNVPRTLMLIDGMRIPPSGIQYDGYDPSILTPLALDRVEILSTGASAVYGSDAINGVVNLILKRGYEGAQTQALYSFSNGTSSSQFQQVAGHKWDGGDVTFTFGYQHADPLAGTARDILEWDFSKYGALMAGLNNTIPLRSSIPATISFGVGATAANPVLPATNPVGASGSGCTNCLLVPAGQNGVGLTWAGLLANPMIPQTGTSAGTSNLVNPLAQSQFLRLENRYSASLTFDQQITNHIKVFFDAFIQSNPSSAGEFQVDSPWNAGSIANLVLPSNNPYYPTGVPAGTSVKVSYSMADEMHIVDTSLENTLHADAGFNFDLPFGWEGKVFYGDGYEYNKASIAPEADTNNINAALGNIVVDPSGQFQPYTVGGVNGPASEPVTAALIAANPALAAYPIGSPIRVVDIPYLNLLCDPTKFQCNSTSTLNFITSHWTNITTYTLQQIGGQADGTLFQLPAGPVKAAVGATSLIENLDTTADRNQGQITDEITRPVNIHSNRQSWAVFGQVDVPLVAPENNIFLIHKLDATVSVRHDNYNDFGGTTNESVAGNWSPFSDFTLRGSWGTSFLAPPFVDISALANVAAVNTAAGASNNTIQVCSTAQINANQPANAGSAAAIILNTIGAANCSNAAITNALAALPASNPYFGQTLAQIRNPGGVSQNGGAASAFGVTRPPGALQPETSTNYSIGFNFSPKEGLLGRLQGLDVNVTYWNVRVLNYLAGPPATDINTPSARIYYTVRGATDNPGASFATVLNAYLTSPAIGAGISNNAATIDYLQDAMIRNLGVQSTDGVDFSVQYHRDMGKWGLWQAGVNGTVFLHDDTLALPGQAKINALKEPVNTYGAVGQNYEPQVHARYEASWRDASRTVDAEFFANYMGGYYNSGTVPSEATMENYLGVPAGSLTGTPLITAYTKLMTVPATYTFDFSIGYQLGKLGLNSWLNGTEVRLTMDNMLDSMPPFFYRLGTGTGGSTAFDPSYFSPIGRTTTLQITKKW